ncbi:DoxX family protein (plasmid) [Streptomyces sp. BI20]|uniref:DoxX family protein n=1 Tax=Streptomyces sp. BI20 TaxID=3403460 RepID=UPI003C7116D4
MTATAHETTPSTTPAPRSLAGAGSPTADTGLLLLRLVLGLTVAAHGAQKLFGWFGGGGIEGTGAFFGASGYPAPEFFAVVAGLTEVLGGLGVALGLLTPLAAAGVAGTLVNAVAVKGLGAFFAPAGVEYELLLVAAAAALALTGPGRYAADRVLPAGLRAPLAAPRTGLFALGLGVLLAVVTLALRA